jgi:hypothetical protein
MKRTPEILPANSKFLLSQNETADNESLWNVVEKSVDVHANDRLHSVISLPHVSEITQITHISLDWASSKPLRGTKCISPPSNHS